MSLSYIKTIENDSRQTKMCNKHTKIPITHFIELHRGISVSQQTPVKCSISLAFVDDYCSYILLFRTSSARTSTIIVSKNKTKQSCSKCFFYNGIFVNGFFACKCKIQRPNRFSHHKTFFTTCGKVSLANASSFTHFNLNIYKVYTTVQLAQMVFTIPQTRARV